MKRILVVDDEPELLEVLREHFEGRYEVETALSGAAAIERFVRQRPDWVFLDINMPGASGLEVLKLLGEFNLMYMDHMAAVATEQAGPRRR